MSCPSCAIGSQVELSAERIVHLCGLENLDNPGVKVFPKLAVCLDCGRGRFTVPEAELLLLARGCPPGECYVAASSS
jgi:hypothetical protein